MITKLTRELEPGDVVVIFGQRRTVASLETSSHVPDLIRVMYVPINEAAGTGGWAEPDDVWQVDAPSKLDLAVQRAQELADHYDRQDEVPVAVRAKDLHDLLALFRAAR